MQGAPKGFIPTRSGIINARMIGTVSDYSAQASYRGPEWLNSLNLDLTQPIVAITCDGGVWYVQMSVQQFAARIVEALQEMEV